MTGSLWSNLVTRTAEKVDRAVGWSNLPTPLAVPVLIGLRQRLRESNLFDTGRGPRDHPADSNGNGNHMTARTLDGTFNDLNDPLMGSLGSRFGRNIPIELTYPEHGDALLEPNPRLVSRRLLTRDVFQPATTLNLLAGAWIQFEVHDWFSHGINDPDNPWEIPLEDDDPWPQHPMQIQRTMPDPSGDPGKPPTYVTADTHWWDASQIYGSDPAFAKALRSGEHGKLRIDELGLPPSDLEKLMPLNGVAGNFWVGLALLHSLFMREHNSICERLHAEYPQMTDQELYDRARLVNAALMAKIHTVDWTTAIIAHPTTVLGMRTNWYGLLGEHFDRLFGRVSSDEVIHGIPGSETNHHGVPYSLTEEFVAVYRMHPLIPDDFLFQSVRDDSVLQQRTLPDLGALEVRNRLGEMSMADIFYSFGRSHPGAITLHNYPKFLQHFNRPSGELIDLASTDILRTRERGVPRYNEFRRLVSSRPGHVVRGDDRQPGLGRAAARDVRRRRAGRPDGGPVRRAQAGGVRFQRHRLPRVHPDGLAPPGERPLLHPGLPARGVHPGRLRLGREQHDAERPAAPLPGAGAGAGGRGEPVRAVDIGQRPGAGAPADRGAGRGPHGAGRDPHRQRRTGAAGAALDGAPAGCPTGDRGCGRLRAAHVRDTHRAAGCRPVAARRPGPRARGGRGGGGALERRLRRCRRWCDPAAAAAKRPDRRGHLDGQRGAGAGRQTSPEGELIAVANVPPGGRGASEEEEQMTTVKHESDVVESKPSRPRRRSSEARSDGSFPELVWTHYRWQEELRASHELDAPAERRYFELLEKFQKHNGEIVSAHWCRYEASAVAITVMPRPRKFWWDNDPLVRYHSATQWATEHEPGIGGLLQAADTLAIKISEVLRGTPEIIGLQLLRCCSAYMLAAVDMTERRASRAEIKTVTDHARNELGRVENYYMRAGTQASRIVYVNGMVLGVALAAVLAAIAVAGVHWFTGINIHDTGVQTFVASYAAGTVGAVVSVLSRMGATPGPGRGQGFSMDFEVGRKSVRRLGVLRPLTGAIFALALYFALQSKLLSIPVPTDGNQVYFYLIVGFLAGFSERVTKVLLTTSADKVLPGSGGDSATDDGQPATDVATKVTTPAVGT